MGNVSARFWQGRRTCESSKQCSAWGQLLRAASSCRLVESCFMTHRSVVFRTIYNHYTVIWKSRILIYIHCRDIADVHRCYCVIQSGLHKQTCSVFVPLYHFLTLTQLPFFHSITSSTSLFSGSTLHLPAISFHYSFLCCRPFLTLPQTPPDLVWTFISLSPPLPLPLSSPMLCSD